MICLILNLYVFISSYGKLSFEFFAYLFVLIVYMHCYNGILAPFHVWSQRQQYLD